jgi:hypothetical protein
MRDFSGRHRVIRLVVLLVVAGSTAVACRGGDPGASASASPSAAPASSTPPLCRNPEGGACLGELEAAHSYHTQGLAPTLTYRVPTKGWFNGEDLPGNFLLVPPGNDLEGVNAGTSDMIGVYTSVAPSRLTSTGQCDISMVRGVPPTPAAMAAWFSARQNLVVSKPRAVTIDSLRGVSIDLRTRPGARLESCTDSGQKVEVAGLFSGLDPSSLDHGVVPGMTMRLDLLAYKQGVLAIEIDDIDRAPATMQELTAVARQFRFG